MPASSLSNGAFGPVLGRADTAVRPAQSEWSTLPCSLTIETVSRTFSKLKALGLIELPQCNRVKLVRFKEFESLANGDEKPRGRAVMTADHRQDER